MESVATTAPQPGFSAIYREHVSFVRGAIRRLGVPSWLEDDAVQDVFVIAHRHLGGFLGEHHDGWLLVIARRVAFRHRRTALRQRRKLDALRTWIGLSPVERPWQAPEARLLLREMTARLVREQHDAFECCEVHGYTAHEAAARLGVNPNTVSTRLRAARHELRRALVEMPTDHAPPSRAAFARGWLLLWPRLVTGSWWPATQAAIWAGCTATLVATGIAALGPGPSPSGPAAPAIATAVGAVEDPATPTPVPAEVPAEVPSIGAVELAPAAVPLQRPSVPADAGTREAVTREAMSPGDAPPVDPSLPLLGAEQLAQAWRALDTGRVDEARRLVDDHLRRYPDSALAVERARLVKRLATHGQGR